MSLTLRSDEDAEVGGKRVLVRVDFNVPMQGGAIVNDARIKAALPTISLLIQKGAAKIIILTHLGRPEGKVVEELQVAPLLERLKQYLDSPLIEMHENLRFDPREEAGDEGFAKELAVLGDLYINDAFSNSHRAHASMVALPRLLPCYAGLDLLSEVAHLSAALSPAHPALAIVGGAKAETKLPLIERLSTLYDTVLVGGALAKEYAPTKETTLLPQDGTPNLKDMLDIGPQTQEAWSNEIKKAAFVLWNGPMGMYEKPEYTRGTDALAKALIESGCRAVIGGGDTEAAIQQFKFDPNRIFVSTGGGAMLEFLANGGTLPALEGLQA